MFHKICYKEVQLPFGQTARGPAGQSWQHHACSLLTHTLPCVQNPHHMKKVFPLAQNTLLSVQLSSW